MGATDDLMTLPPPARREWLREQSPFNRRQIFAAFNRSHGTPYAFWQDDPEGFVRDRLGEFFWSGQNQILATVRDHERVAVVAGAGPGKTHTAGRLVAWWGSVFPPGTAQVVTTAPTFRQVRSLLWPHIRRIVATHQLPGYETCNQTEWRTDSDILAFGFAPNKNEEAASQGIHMEHLLIVVDEAGGIPKAIGENLDALLTGEHSRILCIGNPPVDEQGTWFEQICDSHLWTSMRIGAYDTPNLTGEKVPRSVAVNLPTEKWVSDMIETHGEDSNWVQAKIKAVFPKGSLTKTIPRDWLDRCVGPDVPDEDDGFRTNDWQRLGVDIASDGGDEMVIAHWDGTIGRIVHTSVAADNADQTVVAEAILEWIKHCEAIQQSRGYTKKKVRVKVDVIGVGRGAYDLLVRWGKRGKNGGEIPEHDADIVAVNFSEKATDSAEFLNRRAEAWWMMRELVRGLDVWLCVDEKEVQQLNGPSWFNHASGKKMLEPKKAVSARQGGSPDRADALILGQYEPVTVVESFVSAPPAARRSMPSRPPSRT